MGRATGIPSRRICKSDLSEEGNPEAANDRHQKVKANESRGTEAQHATLIPPRKKNLHEAHPWSIRVFLGIVRLVESSKQNPERTIPNSSASSPGTNALWAVPLAWYQRPGSDPDPATDEFRDPLSGLAGNQSKGQAAPGEAASARNGSWRMVAPDSR